MWISKKKLKKMMEVIAEDAAAGAVYKTKGLGKDAYYYTIEQAEQLLGQKKKELQHHFQSKEFFMDIIETINNMQLPQRLLTKEERDLLS